MLNGTSDIISNNPGIILSNNTCKEQYNWNGYSCKGNNYGLLVFESQDSDKFTRIISPINITSEFGFRNDINSFKDH